jgi:putative cardiolipin synthase
MGARLLEVGAALGRKAALWGDFGNSQARLHAKLAVIDAHRVVIGSMNMDRRSARYNTELALVIDSPALAREVLQLLACDSPSGAYRVRLADAERRLEWIAGEDDREVRQPQEPEVGWGLRLKAGLLASLLSEDLL